jgi:hypothetical protein
MFSNSLESDIMPSTASQVMCSFRRSLNTRMVWYLGGGGGGGNMFGWCRLGLYNH